MGIKLNSADTLSPNGLTTISSNFHYGEAAKKITTNRVSPELCQVVRGLFNARLLGRGGGQSAARVISRRVFAEHVYDRGYKTNLRL